MHSNKLKLWAIGGILGLAFLSACIFTVYESERALVVRLGSIKRMDNAIIVYQPGLHFKLPLVDTTRFFDKRIQTLEEQSSRIVTLNKKDVIVDSFIKWRITDFARFFTSTGGNKLKAEVLLRQKVVDGLRAEFGRRTVQEVVSGERFEVMEDIKNSTNESAKNLGLQVVDVRIKRIDLPPEVSEAVFNRMRTERQRIAAEHRAQGRERALEITADVNAKRTVILAKASSSALQVRGDGDAKAASIYSKSYGADPEFYAFYRSLEAYRETFHPNQDIFVLKPDSDFFKYMEHKK